MVWILPKIILITIIVEDHQQSEFKLYTVVVVFIRFQSVWELWLSYIICCHIDKVVAVPPTIEDKHPRFGQPGNQAHVPIVLDEMDLPGWIPRIILKRVYLNLFTLFCWKKINETYQGRVYHKVDKADMAGVSAQNLIDVKFWKRKRKEEKEKKMRMEKRTKLTCSEKISNED